MIHDPLSIPFVFAILATAIAAITDWRSGCIPNWLTLPLLVVAPTVHAIVHGPPGLGLSLLALFLCGAVPFFLFTKNAMGGGDVKLFAGLGALLGLQIGLQVLLVSLLIVAIYSQTRLAYQGCLIRTLKNVLQLACNPFLPKRLRKQVVPELMSTVRMGAAIALATCCALLDHYPELWLWV
jgi:prepilin peptidase CpaA